MAKRSGKEPYEITSEEALAFIRRMQKRFRTAPRTKAGKARLQKYLAKFTDQQLRAVGHRVQGDLMLRPPKTIPPQNLRKRKQRKRAG